MANVKDVEEQLKRIGCNFRFWGRWEVRELANVVLPGETIEHCVNGMYENGFAILAATDQRILLVDKKPMYLTLEDVRYDMISELDYNHRLLNATLRVCTPNKELRFTSYNGDRLRKLFHYTQHRVMLIRQYFSHQGQGSPLVYDYTAGGGQGAPTQMPSSGSMQPAQSFIPRVVDQNQAGSVQPQAISMSGMKRVAPIINAYTRLTLMSRSRGFRGSSAYSR